MPHVPQYAVTAIGEDQPGIVAAVAEALMEIGGNVEDSAMTILGGHFAIVLLVATDAGRDALAERLADRTEPLGLTVTVSEVAATSDLERAALPTHVLSVYGADRPGLLAGVTRALAEAGANVTDLETRLLNASDTPVYAMIIELATQDEAGVTAAVDAVCTSLGVDHTMRPLDAQTL